MNEAPTSVEATKEPAPAPKGVEKDAQTWEDQKRESLLGAIRVLQEMLPTFAPINRDT